MAENIDVNVNVNTSQANRNLDNLNNRIGKLNQTFGAFRNAIAGIAFGSIVNNLLNFSAAMVDVSNSTDIALEAVVGFSRAVQDNGGDINSAQQALQKFNVTIGDAAQGSAAAQEAFQRVGVSLDDLATLSQQDLLRKTIQGLSQIEDASIRARLASELLGKSFRNIDIKGLAGDYDDAVRGSAKYVSAIRTADQTQQKLEKSITDLRLVLLKVIEPLASLANKIDVTSESFTRFINAVINVGKVLFAIFGIFVPLVRIFTAVRAGISAVTIATTTLGKEFSRFFGNIKGWLTNFSKVGKIISDGIQKATKKIETANDATVVKNAEKRLGYWKALSENFETVKTSATKAAIAIATAVAAAVGYNEKPKFDARNFGAREAGAEDAAIRFPGAAEEEMTRRDIVVALQKQIASLKEVTAAYQRSNAEQIASINIQRISLGMSKDEIDVMNAVDEVIKRNDESIRKLREQKEGLASDSQLIPAINAEIAILEKSLETDKRVTAQAVRNLQARQLEQEKLNKQLEVTAQKLQDAQSLTNLNAQLAIIGQYGDELENNLLILQITEELQGKLTDLAIKQIELENQRIQLGETRFQQELEHLNALREAAYEYAGARLEAEQKILEAQRATREDARAGVEQAMDDIAKQFEPYQQAQDAVKQGWNRISGAIDDFIETGKFNFKDFARSIIADLAKMIAKALVFKAIQGALGMFGLSLPGLANGGPAKQNQPYIVGEKGPELFVPRTSGTVVPNNKLAGMEGRGEISAPITNNYITNNINAVDAKSVAQLFAENRKTLLGAVATAQREMPYMA